ncbi:putative holin-like toxin [Virgibacillus kimchii]
MVTYDTINLLIQFGIFLATGLTAMIAIIALVTERKKK